MLACDKSVEGLLWPGALAVIGRGTKAQRAIATEPRLDGMDRGSYPTRPGLATGGLAEALASAAVAAEYFHHRVTPVRTVRENLALSLSSFGNSENRTSELPPISYVEHLLQQQCRSARKLAQTSFETVVISACGPRNSRSHGEPWAPGSRKSFDRSLHRVVSQELDCYLTREGFIAITGKDHSLLALGRNLWPKNRWTESSSTPENLRHIFLF